MIRDLRILSEALTGVGCITQASDVSSIISRAGRIGTGSGASSADSGAVQTRSLGLGSAARGGCQTCSEEGAPYALTIVGNANSPLVKAMTRVIRKNRWQASLRRSGNKYEDMDRDEAYTGLNRNIVKIQLTGASGAETVSIMVMNETNRWELADLGEAVNCVSDEPYVFDYKHKDYMLNPSSVKVDASGDPVRNAWWDMVLGAGIDADAIIQEFNNIKSEDTKYDNSTGKCTGKPCPLLNAVNKLHANLHWGHLARAAKSIICASSYATE